jgi:ATP-dependent HslUV protease ATP-binding subunit HslU
LDTLLPRAQAGFTGDSAPRDNDTRQRFRKMLREGDLDDREIEIEVRSLPVGVEIMAPPGMEEMTQQLQGMFQSLGGGRSRQRKLKIKEALKLLIDEEAAKMINEEELKARAVDNAEQNGIVSLTRSTRSHGARKPPAPTYRAKACSATFYPSSKAAP